MRALLLVLDSLGVGSAPSHLGAPALHSLGWIFNEVPALRLPTLFGLGLGEVLKGCVFNPPSHSFGAGYGRAIQRSSGTDGLSSLWEMAGVILGCPFAAFERLPGELIAAMVRESGVEFLLNPSGLPPIAEELREEHQRTGKPILTFDSEGILRLAAHQAVIPLDRLIRIARAVRRQCDGWRITRVVAEPFQGGWEPSSHVFELSIVPPRTILNALSEKGYPVETIGGIGEAFAHSGITRSHDAANRAERLQLIEQLWRSPQHHGFVFARLDHPGNAVRCARALEEFDQWLGTFLTLADADDLIVITGSNDGRERQELPILIRHDGFSTPLGVRNSLADIAATLGAFFGISEHGRPWPLGEPMADFHRPRFNGP